MNLNGSDNRYETCCTICIYVKVKVRHLSGYANIKPEKRNGEKQCLLFNNLLDKKS